MARGISDLFVGHESFGPMSGAQMKNFLKLEDEAIWPACTAKTDV